MVDAGLQDPKILIFQIFDLLFLTVFIYGQVCENGSLILTTMVKKWFWTPILGSAMVPTHHGLRRPRGTRRKHRSVTQLPKLAPPAP